VTTKPFAFIKSLDERDIPTLNKTITRAYQTRLEGIYHREESGVFQLLYQSIETGDVYFSANGSPTTQRTFALAEKQHKILFAKAEALDTRIKATITDVTLTAVTIALSMISATGNFSAVTTASIRVFYEVKGSNP